MRSLTKAFLVCASALALTATTAAADVVCNDEGECWHVKTRHEYSPEFKLHVHPDDWKWEEKEHYKWREHEGDKRGYWKSGVWIEF